MMVDRALLKIGDYVDPFDLALLGPLEVPIPKRWFVLQLHTNRESKVMRTFRRRNISAYLPTIVRSQCVTRRRMGYSSEHLRDVTLPLFPGLIFIPDFQCKLGGLLDVDGVDGFLRFGNWTARLSPKLISDIRIIAEIGSTAPSRRKRLYALGQMVRVSDGPFASFNGTIERLDSRGRLSVLVDLFKRMVPVEFTEDQIEAV
jgi:transcriptional antiterminator NusG